MGEVVIGISGASGAIYGVRLAEVLSDMGKTIRLVVTDSGKITLKHECDTTPEAVAEATNAILEDAKNVGAKSASGSAKIDAVDQAYWDAEIRPLVEAHDNIEYIGEVNEAQKAELLGGAGALLFPIDWPEPFGLVMIEAMSCGTPVIAWRNGSVPEVMQDKVSGRIVDTMDDAVAAVDEVFGFDRAKVRDYFERRFTVRRMADDYVQMFEQQIARHQNLRATNTVDVFPDALRHGSFRAAPPPALDTAA